MKKLISLALLGATSSLMALGAEHAYLYKDPRIMGMGGANIAVGAYSTSVFSNPAGLMKIKQEHGIVADVLNIGLSISTDFQVFADDLEEASDSGNDSDMIRILQKYSGDNFHLGVDNYSSVSMNHGDLAWSIGLLAATDVNMMAHGNGSPSGGILETTTRAYGGLVLGVAKPYDTPYGKVDVGVGLKYISLTSVEGSLGVVDLMDDDEDSEIADILEEKFKQESSGIGIDIGATIYPFVEHPWNPAFGISILNIGSISMGNNYGGQPTTINIGASATPDVPYIDNFVLAIDYVDIFNANNTRIYEYSTDGKVQYSDYKESDILKRIRIGAGIGLIDSSYFSSTLNLGIYQGAYTAGLNMDITILKFNFTTYQEQVGTGGIDISDRRYIAQLGIGW